MQEVEPRDRNGRPQLSQTNFRVPSSRSAYGSTPGWVEKATKDFLDDAGDTEPGIGIKKLPYTRPQLRETIKRRIMAGSNGGRPGQWSARKAQLLAQEYRRAGGGYRGKPGRAQRSLKKWTSERWTTSDGKPARRNGRMTRYLPAAAWKRLTPAQRRATIAKKLAGDKAGRQFVANTQRAASASKKIRSKTLGPSVEEVAKNPNAPQVFSDTSSEKDRIISTEPLEQPFSPNKEKLNEIANAPSYGDNPPVKPFIPGNLDIDNREPIEKQNGDLALIEPIIIDGVGDESGMFIIVPLITKFGQSIEPSNASSYFSKNGEHLGKFKTREDAEKYLEWLKDIEEEISYRDKKKPIISMHPIEKIAQSSGDGFESRRMSIKNTIKRIADKYMTEKALGPSLRAVNSLQIYDPDAFDADNDGFVQDATPWMRPSLPSSPIIAGLRSAGKSNIASQRAIKEAQEFTKFVSQHEPQLTEMMKSLANKKGSSLYLRGLKNRQKPVESLALKAQRLQHLFDGDLTDSITSMNDPLRYTFESDDINKYTNDVLDVISALAKKGHNASVTNYWTSGDPYKGVNVMVDHPDGFFYEIQFHTPSSYRLKNKLTPLYEKYRNEKNVKKRQEIYDEMLKLSKGVSIPKEIGKFGEPLSRGSGQADFKPARPGKLIPTPLGNMRRKPGGMSSTSRIDFIKEETARQEKLLDKITTEQFKEKWGPLFDILDMSLGLSDSEIILKNKKGNNLLSRAGLDDLNKVFMYKRDKIRENPLNYDSPELERIIDAIDKFALDGEEKEFVLNQAKEMLRLRKLFENTGRIKGANLRPMNRDFISAREFVKVPYRGAWIYPDGKIYPVFWHGDEHDYINSFKDGILRLDTARVTRQGGGVHLNLDAKIEKLTPSQIETVVELYEGFGQPKLAWEIQGDFFRFDEDEEIKNQGKAARQKILRESLSNDLYTNLTSVGGMSSRRRDMTDSERERFRPIELAPDEKTKLQPGTTLVYADEDDRIIRTELIGPQVARVRGIPGLKLYTDPSPDNQNEVDAQMREWDELYGPVSSTQRQAKGRSQPKRDERSRNQPRQEDEDPLDRINRLVDEDRKRRGLESRRDNGISPQTSSIDSKYPNISRFFSPRDKDMDERRFAEDTLRGLSLDRAEEIASEYAASLDAVKEKAKEDLISIMGVDGYAKWGDNWFSTDGLNLTESEARRVDAIDKKATEDALQITNNLYNALESASEGSRNRRQRGIEAARAARGMGSRIDEIREIRKAKEKINDASLPEELNIDEYDDDDDGLTSKERAAEKARMAAYEEFSKITPEEHARRAEMQRASREKLRSPESIESRRLARVKRNKGKETNLHNADGTLKTDEERKLYNERRGLHSMRSTTLEQISDEEISALATRKGLRKKDLDVLYKSIVDARDFLRTSKGESLAYAPGLGEETARRMRDSIRIEMAPNGVPMVIAEPFEAVIDEIPDKRDWSRVLAPSIEDMQRLVDAIREAQDSDLPIRSELSEESKDRVNNAAYSADESESPFGKIIAQIVKKLGSAKYEGTPRGAVDSWVGIYVEGLANPKSMQAGAGSDGIHDFFGHFGIGRGFDRHGEWAAALATDSLIRDHPAFDFLTPDERESLRREFFTGAAGGAFRLGQQLDTEYEQRFGISRDFATQRFDIPSRRLVDVADTRTPEERDTAKAFLNIDNIAYGELAAMYDKNRRQYFTMDEVLDLLGVPPTTTRVEARGMKSTRSSRNSIPFTKASDDLLLSIAGNEAAIKQRRSTRDNNGMSSRAARGMRSSSSSVPDSPERNIAKSYFGVLMNGLETEDIKDLSFNLLMDKKDITDAALNYVIKESQPLIDEGRTAEEIAQMLDIPLLGFVMALKKYESTAGNDGMFRLLRSKLTFGPMVFGPPSKYATGEKHSLSAFQLLHLFFDGPGYFTVDNGSYARNESQLGKDLIQVLGVDKEKAMRIFGQSGLFRQKFPIESIANIFDVDLETATSAKYQASLPIRKLLDVSRELDMSLINLYESPISNASRDVRMLKSPMGMVVVDDFADMLKEESRIRSKNGDEDGANEINKLVAHILGKDTSPSGSLDEMSDEQWMQSLEEKGKLVNLTDTAEAEELEQIDEDIFGQLEDGFSVNDIAENFETTTDDVRNYMLGYPRLPQDKKLANSWIYRNLIPTNPGIPASNKAEHANPVTNPKMLATLLEVPEDYIIQSFIEYAEDNDLPTEFLLEAMNHHGLNISFIARVLQMSIADVIKLQVDMDIEHEKKRLQKGLPKMRGSELMTPDMRFGGYIKNLHESDGYSILEISLMLDMDPNEVEKFIDLNNNAWSTIRKLRND